MQPLRRTAVSAARKGRVTLPRQPRRYAHDEHAHGHSAHTVNESFGKGLWLPISVFPIGYIVYQLSRQDPDSPPFLTRMIQKYTEKQDDLARTNALHSAMMQQAGSDRVLFMSSKGSDHFEMKFPEIMNVGSPYNVPAGSVVNMDKVIEKYTKIANEDNERKLEQLRTNQVPAEQELSAEFYTYRGKELSRAAR